MTALIRSVKLRSANPTTAYTSERVARKRRRETYEAAQQIHGGSDVDGGPGEAGLVDTVMKKCGSCLVAEEVMKSKRIMHEVKKKRKIEVKNYKRKGDGVYGVSRLVMYIV